MTTQKDFVKTSLRVPRDLHDEIHVAAAEAERTFNAELLHRLRSTFKPKRTPTKARNLAKHDEETG